MPRNMLDSFIEFIVVGVALIGAVLLGIMALTNYLISIGITFNTASDILTLFTVIISLTAFVVTSGWNYWIFRITSHEYRPVLKAEFISVPPFTKVKGVKFVVNLRNVGKRDLVPSKVSFTGSWFEGEIDCERVCDFIQPGEAEKARGGLPYPGHGYHNVIVRVIDEEAGLIWKKDKDFYVPRPVGLSVVR